MSKYGNIKTYYGGKKFDSRKEKRRFVELSLMQTAGVIKNLKTQVPYILVPAQYDEDGKLIERSVVYKADFVYEKDGKTVVEDTKGAKTDVYIIKRKLMYKVYGIKILET